MTREWSTPADIEKAVRRRWESGELLRAHGEGRPFTAIDIPLRGPTPGEAAGDLGRVRHWVSDLESGSRRRGGASYQLQMRALGGRAMGRNEVPGRALVTTYEEAWRLLGVHDRVNAFDHIMTSTSQALPELRTWVLEHPLRALSSAAPWPRLLSATIWLRDNGGLGKYLRQIDVAGLDTKFVEQHRGLLADLLDELLPPSAVDLRWSRGREFAARYGFRLPEPLVRMRAGEGVLPVPAHVSELALHVDELALLAVPPCHVVVVENEVTFLSLPIAAGELVIFGSGYTVARLGRIHWLASCRVHYWGDVDTHGFAILSRLRTWLPHVRSLLMDRETFLAHRERWGTEPTPTRARLDRLSVAEGDLYQDLVEDVFGASVRLEQERISWRHVTAALTAVTERGGSAGPGRPPDRIGPRRQR